MAKKKEVDKIETVFVEDIMKRDYIAYALSVITDRSIPSILDGLKPVQRRIMWVMRNADSYTKSARHVGDVLGKYHPHSETAVYDSLVRMTQDWKMYIPLIDGHGNFGSIDSDPAAAMRYTEARIERSAKDIYFTYNQLGIEYTPNYDNREKEPLFLTSPLPMVLVNGSYGTAVGFATAIPPHNPKEVANAYLAFIDGKLTNKNITKFIKGPDNPYPCKIIDRGGIERAYQTGRGSYSCLMDYHIEDASYGRSNIVFTTILPLTDKSSIVEKIANLVKAEKFGLQNLISDLRDESSQGDIRIIVTTKKGVSVDTVIEKLVEAKVIYDRFNISIVVIVDNCPKVLGIMDLFTEFHKSQREISSKHLNNVKAKLNDRLELLDGIVVAIKNYDKVASLIKNSKSKEDARDKIKKAFKGLNDNQVNAILETKLINLINKGDAIISEQKEIKAQIKNIEVTLKDIDTYIKNNINELLLSLKPYNRRRSTIIKEESNGSK